MNETFQLQSGLWDLKEEDTSSWNYVYFVIEMKSKAKEILNLSEEREEILKQVEANGTKTYAIMDYFYILVSLFTCLLKMEYKVCLTNW